MKFAPLATASALLASVLPLLAANIGDGNGAGGGTSSSGNTSSSSGSGSNWYAYIKYAPGYEPGFPSGPIKIKHPTKHFPIYYGNPRNDPRAKLLDIGKTNGETPSGTVPLPFYFTTMVEDLPFDLNWLATNTPDICRNLGGTDPEKPDGPCGPDDEMEDSATAGTNPDMQVLRKAINTKIGDYEIDNRSMGMRKRIIDVQPGANLGGATCSMCSGGDEDTESDCEGVYRTEDTRDAGGNSGSFGKEYTGWDSGLDLYFDSNGNPRIEFNNPSAKGPRPFSQSGNIFIEPYYNSVKSLKLLDAQGNVTLDFKLAKRAQMLLKTDGMTEFEIFVDQDNADPKLCSYHGRPKSFMAPSGKKSELTYLDAADSPSATPQEKKRYSSFVDRKGRVTNMNWKSTLVGGHCVIDSIQTHDGQQTHYTYDADKLVDVAYADGSHAKTEWSVDPSGLTVAHRVEPRAKSQKDITAYYSSASVELVNKVSADGSKHFNQASLLCRAVTSGNECRYLSIFDPDHHMWRKIYEGGGKLKQVDINRAETFKTWALDTTKAATDLNAAFSGTKEPTKIESPYWYYGQNAKGLPPRLSSPDGTEVKYSYSANNTPRSKQFTDGTYERSKFDSANHQTLSQDRSGRIQTKTYTSFGKVASRTTGQAMQRVNQVNTEAPGLVTRSYSLEGGSTLPDFIGLTPYATERSVNFSIPDVLALDNFGIVYEGKLNVAAAGDYTFFVKADDGAKLFIDGQEVVATPNWNTEGASSLINLSAGSHVIRLTYFEIGGAENLSVKWQGPGITKQPIPASVLTHTVVEEEVELVAAAASTETFEYYPAGHSSEFLLKSKTDARGIKTHEYIYGPDHLLEQVLEVNDNDQGMHVSHTYTYINGIKNSVTDSNGRTTNYEYDSIGRLIKTTYYDGSTDQAFFNELGQLYKTKDRLGYTILMEYDAANRVVRTIRGYSRIVDNQETLLNAAEQQVIVKTYVAGSELIASITRDGERTDMAYDVEGRLIASTVHASATQELTSRKEFSEGKLFCEVDPYERRTYHLYRASDAVEIRTVQFLVADKGLLDYGAVAALPRDLTPNPDYIILDRIFDASGNIIATIDPKGIRSELILDSHYRVIRNLQAVAMDPFYNSSTYSTVDIINTAVTLAGSWIPSGLSATPKLINNSISGQISFWAVAYDGSTYTKAVKIILTPTSSGGINTQVVSAKYITGNNIDFDFNNGGNVAPIAVSTSSSGYTFSAINFVSLTPTSTPTDSCIISETEYDQNGNVLVSKKPRFFSENIPAKKTFKYNNRNRISEIIEGDGASTKSSYYDDGKIQEIIDSLGNHTSYSWPTCCNGTSVITDSTDVAQITNKNYNGLVTHQVTKKDASTCHCSPDNPANSLTLSESTSRYDSQGRMIANTIWFNPLDYVDPNDPQIANSKSEGMTTTYQYYKSVMDVSELAPSLAKVGTVFSQGITDGSATVVTNPAGEKTVSIFDGAGRIILEAQINPNSFEPITWVLMNYDNIDNGLVESTQIDAFGHASKVRTDALNRPRVEIDSSGGVSYIWFDANGNVVKTRNSLDIGTDCVYDVFNRRISSSNSQQQIEGNAIKTTYNTSGSIVTQVDAKGQVTAYSYDLRDRLVCMRERNSGEVHYAYDLKGQKTSVVDQLGHVTSYEYSSRGENIKTINADGSMEQQIFDALGRKAKVVHPGGNVAVMAYDNASRLLSRSYFVAGSGIPESVDVFTYDNASRPLTANNADCQISFAYDTIGRRRSLTQTVDGIAKNINFAYDAANRLISRSIDDLAEESRSFTNRGQIAQVKLGSQVIADFNYDAIGRETSRLYGNGIQTLSSYSRADNLVTSISVNGKPELSFDYTYDANNNVTGETRGGLMNAYSWQSTFDIMDRLNSQNDQANTRAWNLDLIGNINSETINGNIEARTSNNMQAPVIAGNKIYAYDGNGQMTSKPGHALVWDARNYLSSSIKGTDSAILYGYDAFGNRVKKGNTRYLLVDNQVVAEFNNGISKQYIYGEFIDEVLAEQKQIGISESTIFYHRNRQYNTIGLTDVNRISIELYSFDAMGRINAFEPTMIAKTAPLGTSILFTGRVWDPETSLYYFRARYLDPELGTFISRDPLGFINGLNSYNAWFEKYYQMDPSGLAMGHHIIPRHLWECITDNKDKNETSKALYAELMKKGNVIDTANDHGAQGHGTYNRLLKMVLEEFFKEGGCGNICDFLKLPVGEAMDKLAALQAFVESYPMEYIQIFNKNAATMTQAEIKAWEEGPGKDLAIKAERTLASKGYKCGRRYIKYAKLGGVGVFVVLAGVGYMVYKKDDGTTTVAKLDNGVKDAVMALPLGAVIDLIDKEIADPADVKIEEFNKKLIEEQSAAEACAAGHCATAEEAANGWYERMEAEGRKPTQ